MVCHDTNDVDGCVMGLHRDSCLLEGYSSSISVPLAKEFEKGETDLHGCRKCPHS